MAIVMDPATVLAVTGATVPQLAIDVAAELIETRTGNTPDGNVDNRSLSEASVSTAWAIIATRVDARTRGGDSAPISESESDYSYSVDRNEAVRARDLFHGLPMDLLNLSASSWSHRHGMGTMVPAHPFWDDLDQQYPGFVDQFAPTYVSESGRYPIV